MVYAMLQNGTFTALNDPDELKIRASIGVYYNHFTKPSDDENVVFVVPYNDTGGLGIMFRAVIRPYMYLQMFLQSYSTFSCVYLAQINSGMGKQVFTCRVLFLISCMNLF